MPISPFPRRHHSTNRGNSEISSNSATRDEPLSPSNAVIDSASRTAPFDLFVIVKQGDRGRQGGISVPRGAVGYAGTGRLIIGACSKACRQTPQTDVLSTRSKQNRPYRQ